MTCCAGKVEFCLITQRFLQATPPLLNGAFKDNITRLKFHALLV